MKIILKLITLSFFLTPFLLGGQNYFLVKKNNSKRTKILYFDNFFTIKTNDTTYFSKIVKASDSTLTITIDVRSNDSIMEISKSADPKYDTVYTHWHKETIQVLHRDIIHLEKDLLKNRKWLDPFVWAIVGGGIGVLIMQGTNNDLSEGAKVGVGLTGGILGITVPLIYICTRTTKFDMKTKWSFTKK